jgi:ribosomal protein L11 methyltransferase
VDDLVRIRAEFHAASPGLRHEIVITPRMAFGTGHHATTRMMVRAMLGLDLAGQHVCDLGCGTGVLAILAERLGATSVLAVDIDDAAVENTLQNAALNGCDRIIVEKGDVARLEGHRCGTILANIERNTLMRDMEAMAHALVPGGALLLSGFVVEDRHMMAQAAARAGLTVLERLREGDWALIGCRKNA